MSESQNKDIALAWLDALGRCDIDKLSALSTDDMTWWIMPGNKFSGTHNKRDYLTAIPNLFADASGDLQLSYGEITAEDDRVAVVAQGDLPLKNGKHYKNNYHFLFHFRDGKVAIGKEFTDSLHVNEIFGGP